MILTPKNWKEFQHYSNRKPPWIKLHKVLLDDFQFASLPVASRALAPLLWLLASEYHGGKIDATEAEICFRLHLSEKELATSLKPLIDNGFFIASDMLAPSKQSATLEIEEEREVEKEKEVDIGHRVDDLEFDTFWKAYPRKVAKKAAQKAFMKARKETNLESIIASLNAQIPGWDDPQYIPHPASWLNGGRWADETISQKGKGNGKSEGGILAALDDTRERIKSLRLRDGTGAGNAGLLPQGGSQRSENLFFSGGSDVGRLSQGGNRPSNPSANGITQPDGFHADTQGIEIRAGARDSET